MNGGAKPSRLVRLFAALERVVIASLMAAIALLTLAQVFWRYGLQSPLQWSEEVARYCFVWVTFLGAAALMRMREGHPAIDTLYLHVGPRMQRVMDITSRLAVIAASLAIAVGGFRMVQLQWQQLSPSLEIPMAWIYAAMGVGPLIGIFWVIWCARQGCLEDEA
jgi:TRAP-type transport system small permease protein